MKNVNTIVLASATLFITCGMRAQTVTLDGEFRPRVEVRDGFSQPLLKAQDPLVIGLQRTRLGVNFKTGILSTKLTIQDARTYGETATTSEASTTDGSTSIFEAWAEMLIIPGGSIKVGRQVLKYDDGRLFTDPAWSNTGTSHDVALFKYAINNFQANMGLAYNNNSTASNSETYYTPTCKYRYMGLLWAHQQFTNNLGISLIGVDQGVQDTIGLGSTTKYNKVNMYHNYTYGGYLTYGSDNTPLSLAFTYYKQSGKTSIGKTLNASLTAVKIGWGACPEFGLNAGFDLFSGDSNTKDNTQRNFIKLYGANHSFNGYMEYWTTPPTQGLGDYYITALGKATSKLSWEAVGHLFKSIKDVAYATNSESKSLGSELDLTLKYKMNEWATLQGGYSRYFTTKATKYLKLKSSTADTYSPQWCYIMLTISPSYIKEIFTNKK